MDTINDRIIYLKNILLPLVSRHLPMKNRLLDKSITLLCVEVFPPSNTIMKLYPTDLNTGTNGEFIVTGFYRSRRLVENSENKSDCNL